MVIAVLYLLCLVLSRWIDLFDEEEVIRQRVNYLKDRHWIDKQTKEVTFSILILNGQYEPLVCESLLTFDFSRGACNKRFA